MKNLILFRKKKFKLCVFKRGKIQPNNIRVKRFKSRAKLKTNDLKLM